MVDYYEARRYSAVLLHDPRIADVSALGDALGVGPRDRQSVLKHGTVQLTRATFGSRRPHYPPSVRVIVAGEGNPNQIYIARSSPKPKAPLVLAAPYVNLLAEALAKIDSSMAGDEPLVYVRPNMSELFDHFEKQTHRFVKATQIQVSMKRGGVDKVSLSGDNPLRSDLRRALLSVAKPSGIRLRSTHAPQARPTNIYLDFDGNLFWHLSNEGTWANVTPVLELLTTSFGLETTVDNPLRKQLAKQPNPGPEETRPSGPGPKTAQS